MNLSATAALTRRPFSCHVWINVAQIQLSTLAILHELVSYSRPDQASFLLSCLD